MHPKPQVSADRFVFPDVADMEGLRNNVAVSKALGFEGMGCNTPQAGGSDPQGFAPEPE
jgi:hypothetical protein